MSNGEAHRTANHVRDIMDDTLRGLHAYGMQVSAHLFGQEINAKVRAICKVDPLLVGKGQAADSIAEGPERFTLANGLSRMKQKAGPGSRIAEVHNERSLLAGDTDRSENDILRWTIKNDRPRESNIRTARICRMDRIAPEALFQ